MAEHTSVANTEKQESCYFSSYEDLGVHELMLKDEPRTRAYQIFIETHSEFIKDKIVIDVGAGSGILSLFAAKAGAKKVFAVEASNLAKLCADIVSVNGYSDIVEVVHSRVEDANLPIEDSSADVILSEWMGFYLLHEAMLSSVIFARDKWLKPDGILVPSVASVYMCPVNMGHYMKKNVDIWDNAYGFNFEPLKKCVQEKHMAQPLVQTVDSTQCLANSEAVTHLHLKYVAREDLYTIRRNLSFHLTKNSICHGFALWFVCNFEAPSNRENVFAEETSIILDTGPGAPPTHWKQTIVLLPDALMVNKGDPLACKLEMQQDRENLRRYNICVELDDDESEDENDIVDCVNSEVDDDITDLLTEVMEKSKT